MCLLMLIQRQVRPLTHVFSSLGDLPMPVNEPQLDLMLSSDCCSAAGKQDIPAQPPREADRHRLSGRVDAAGARGDGALDAQLLGPGQLWDH